MERRVGEVFEIDGDSLMCVKHDGCTGCVFEMPEYIKCSKPSLLGSCCRLTRRDDNNVIFVRTVRGGIMERRVGEVFEIDGDSLICVKDIGCTCVGCAFYPFLFPKGDCLLLAGNCLDVFRSDRTIVIFLRIVREEAPWTAE